jgi:hypothetical protein
MGQSADQPSPSPTEARGYRVTIPRHVGDGVMEERRERDAGYGPRLSDLYSILHTIGGLVGLARSYVFPECFSFPSLEIQLDSLSPQ